MLDTVRTAVLEALAEKKQLLVALDGRSCSGKTSLAAALVYALASQHTVALLHTDDFYLPRASHDYGKIGGNMDLDRLFALLQESQKGEAVVYRPFCCATQGLGDAVTLPQAEILLVEGSYALHPTLFPLYDLRFCLWITREEQAARVLQREGEGARVFFEKWFPLEERYLSTLPKEGIRHL